MISKAWQPAVQETVSQYVSNAQRSFESEMYLEGAELLADAVRTTLGYIAAERHWPHADQGDLYSIIAALSNNNGWPETLDAFDQALDNYSEEAKRLASATGTSIGLPRQHKIRNLRGESAGGSGERSALRRNRHKPSQPACRSGKGQQMNPDEHIQEARDLIARAQEETIHGGNDRIAAELL